MRNALFALAALLAAGMIFIGVNGGVIAQGTPQEITRPRAVLDVYLGEPEAS